MKTIVKSILFICAILLVIAFVDFNKDEEKNHVFSTTDKMLFAHRGLAEFAENSWQGFKQSQKQNWSNFASCHYKEG